MTTVLFACVHNAGRSQMAAALFNLEADPARARGISAGTQPGPHVHPEVLETMRELGAIRDDWPLEDPKGKPVARVREIRDQIRQRVRDLVPSSGWAR